jgi:hypothetical protein
MKRTVIAGIATAAFVSGGLGLAGFMLAEGTAQATSGLVPQYNWCPGQPWGFLSPPPADFDWTVCHELEAVSHQPPDGQFDIIEIPNPPPANCPPSILPCL